MEMETMKETGVEVVVVAEVQEVAEERMEQEEPVGGRTRGRNKKKNAPVASKGTGKQRAVANGRKRSVKLSINNPTAQHSRIIRLMKSKGLTPGNVTGCSKKDVDAIMEAIGVKKRMFGKTRNSYQAYMNKQLKIEMVWLEDE